MNADRDARVSARCRGTKTFAPSSQGSSHLIKNGPAVILRRCKWMLAAHHEEDGEPYCSKASRKFEAGRCACFSCRGRRCPGKYHTPFLNQSCWITMKLPEIDAPDWARHRRHDTSASPACACVVKARHDAQKPAARCADSASPDIEVASSARSTPPSAALPIRSNGRTGKIFLRCD